MKFSTLTGNQLDKLELCLDWVLQQLQATNCFYQQPACIDCLSYQILIHCQLKSIDWRLKTTLDY